MFMRFIIASFIIIFSSSVYGQTQDIVATVNDTSITEHDIKKRANLVIFSSGLSDDRRTYESIKPKILDMLIDEKLITLDAAKNDVKVEEQEISQAFNSLAERNNLSKEAFKVSMKSKKINEDELLNQIKHQILWNKVIRVHLQPYVEVSKQEITENRKNIETIAGNRHQITDVKIAEILLTIMKEKDFDNQSKLAKQLVKQLREGADFSKVARQFSDALSKNQGGEIGWIPVSQMMPELANILIKIKVNEVSEPIILPDGIHILKVLDRKVISDDPKSFTDEEIKEILMNKKLNVVIRAYLRKLHNNAYINIKNKNN